MKKMLIVKSDIPETTSKKKLSQDQKQKESDSSQQNLSFYVQESLSQSRGQQSELFGILKQEQKNSQKKNMVDPASILELKNQQESSDANRKRGDLNSQVFKRAFDAQKADFVGNQFDESKAESLLIKTPRSDQLASAIIINTDFTGRGDDERSGFGPKIRMVARNDRLSKMSE